MLVWHLRAPKLAIASAPFGGGIGVRHWVLNAQVPRDYARVDIDEHLEELAAETSCSGPGVGFLTAADVGDYTRGDADGVTVFATVGVRDPVWAAAPDAVDTAGRAGTINVVAFLPRRLSDAALVNAVMTATEAKTQALVEAAVPGSGTASDAVCVLVPVDGPVERYGGPRSALGSRLARAVHTAVATGIHPAPNADDTTP